MDEPAAIVAPKESVEQAGIGVRILHNGALQLTEDVRFDVKDLPGVTLAIDVPQGFICDGASIPRCFWWLVGHPLDGGPLKAAICHDAICNIARNRSERRFADTVFMWVMELERVPKWRRALMFLAVRGYATFIWRPK